MPTVVIIHAAEDALPARALAEKLRQTRLTVELEKAAGEDLRSAVRTAAVSIALWSPRSAAQAGLVDDVAYARGKSAVVHASMQSAPPPEQFRGDDAVNLTGWRGEDDFSGWRELVRLVTEKAGVSPLPQPGQRQGGGFFQPGRPSDAGAEPAQPQRAPPPRAAPRPAPQAATRSPVRPVPSYAPPPVQVAEPPPTRTYAPYEPAEPEPRKSGGGMVMGALAFIAIAAAGGGGYYFWSQSQTAQTTSASWDNVDRSSASELRAFLAANPGSMREEAESALADLEERTFEAASDADSIEALEAFVTEFPDSAHRLAAQGRVAELRTLAPSQDAPIVELTPEAVPDPDLVPPDSEPALAPRPTPVPLSPPTSSSGGPATIAPPPAPQADPPPAAPPARDLPIN